jgi:hypothetical protein
MVGLTVAVLIKNFEDDGQAGGAVQPVVNVPALTNSVQAGR